MERLREKLKELVLENAVLPTEDLKENADLVEDLGYDSIAIIRLINDIEETFDITLDDDFLLIEVISKFENLLKGVTETLQQKGE